MHNSESDILKFFKSTLESLRKSEGEHELRTLMVILDPLLVQLEEYPIPQKDLNQIKTQTSKSLAQNNNFKNLKSYILHCDSFAERGRLDGFPHACIMRSRLKILFDEFLSLIHI